MDQVWQVLEHSVSPEVQHFRQGTHPGATWWLKTAIVKQDHHVGLAAMWHALQRTYPHLVRITPHCWDWRGNLIPWASSVWICQGRDVLVEAHESDWVYHVMSSDISDEIWCEQLHAWIKGSHNKTMRKQDPTTWHKWRDSIQLKENWCSEHEARLNRTHIRVISHAEDSSSAHNS